MFNLGEIQRRLAYLFHKRRRDRELEDEMRHHLAMREQHNRSAGMLDEEARYAARRRFGNTALMGEEGRGVWGWSELEGLLKDIRIAFRSMRRNVMLAAAIVITLAIGIGANTALFGVGYALLLRPLAIPDPGGLKMLIGRTGDGEDRLLSVPAVESLRERSQSLASIGVYGSPGPALVSLGSAGLEVVHREQVDSGYFATLGLRPSAGRFFDKNDDRVESRNVVVSHEYWTRRFNASPTAVGETIRFGGRPFTIIGVASPGFAGMTPERPVGIWFASTSHRQLLECRANPGCTSFRALARLKPGVRTAQAETEIRAIFRGHLLDRARTLSGLEREALLRQSIEATYGGAGISPLGRQFRSPLLALIALAGLVLLLACVNVSNMLVARAVARSRELAIRVAIGAGRRHVIRQVFAEGVLHACLGGALGLAVALWGARVLARLCSDASYRSSISVGPDAVVLAFAVAVSLAAGLFASFIPAARAARGNVLGGLNGAGSGLRIGRWHIRRVLAATQVALCIVLLVCAGLFARSLSNLTDLRLGFPSGHVVTFAVTTPTDYAMGQGPAVWRLLDKVRQIPDVAAAGMVDHPPPMPNPLRLRIKVAGYTPRPGEDTAVNAESASDGLFEALGASFRYGRPMQPGDRNRKVAVVNDEFVNRFFGGVNPVGRYVDVEPEIQFHGPTDRFEIVGVVSGLRYFDPRKGPEPAIFPNTATPGVSSFVVRTGGPPDALIAALPEIVRQAEPGLRVFGLETVRRTMEQVLARERLLANLSGAFGLMAIGLAAVGVYGVMSCSVAQLTAEIGIRMALGAQRRAVLWMVLRETVVMLLCGVAVGVPAALIAGRSLASLQLGLKPADPVVIAAAVLVMTAAAIIVACVPARRASRIDAIRALRQD